MRSKIVNSKEVSDLIHDGMTIMFGGFMANGTAETIVDLMIEKGVKDLTIIANDTSYPHKGLGRLVVARQVKKVIASHIGLNPEVGKQMLAGELDVELSPQGTLAERIRAGGAGLGGVLTPTGVGTEVENGKQKLTINGKEYLLELPLKADLAIIRGSVVDKAGNVYYKGTTKNFNPLIAMAADVVICEAEELVEIGQIDPNSISTQGIFVDYILEV